MTVFRRFNRFLSGVAAGILGRLSASQANASDSEPRSGASIRGADLQPGDRDENGAIVSRIIFSDAYDRRLLIVLQERGHYKGYFEKIWISEYENVYSEYWSWYFETSELEGLYADADLVEKDARRLVPWLAEKAST